MLKPFHIILNYAPPVLQMQKNKGSAIIIMVDTHSRNQLLNC